MKIPILCPPARLLAANFALGLLAAGANAQSFSFPGVVNNGGGTFYFSDNTYAIGSVIGTGGFGLTDADFGSVGNGGLNAFDGAFLMSVNGTLFASPAGTTTLSGNTLSTGTSTYNNIATSAQFTFLGNTYPIMRAIYSFTDTSSSPITANLTWQVNLGSDNTTQVGAVSGLTPQTPPNRWIVSTDAAGQDPVVTLARYGTNSNETLPASTGLFTGPNGDLLTDQYRVTLNPNQTVELMMFTELTPNSSGTNAAATAAAVFDNYGSMASAGLLVGLNPNNLDPIINWSVPEPGVGALLALAASGAWLLRRRSRRE